MARQAYHERERGMSGGKLLKRPETDEGSGAIEEEREEDRGRIGRTKDRLMLCVDIN
jgi:hypothetical protein